MSIVSIMTARSRWFVHACFQEYKKNIIKKITKINPKNGTKHKKDSCQWNHSEILKTRAFLGGGVGRLLIEPMREQLTLHFGFSRWIHGTLGSVMNGIHGSRVRDLGPGHGDDQTAQESKSAFEQKKENLENPRFSQWNESQSYKKI